MCKNDPRARSLGGKTVSVYGSFAFSESWQSSEYPESLTTMGRESFTSIYISEFASSFGLSSWQQKKEQKFIR